MKKFTDSRYKITYTSSTTGKLTVDYRPTQAALVRFLDTLHFIDCEIHEVIFEEGEEL